MEEYTPIFHYSPKLKITWFQDLNVGPVTIKLLEKTEKKLTDIGGGNDFSAVTPKGPAIKPKINKWDYIKLKFSLWQKNQKTLDDMKRRKYL